MRTLAHIVFHALLILACTTLRLPGVDLANLAWTKGGGAINSADGEINAVCRVGTDLVVAGRFNAISGTAVSNIARWDGDSWHAMGTLDGQVMALAVDGDGVLWAGGQFTERLVTWNGTGWSALPSGVTGQIVNAIAVADGGIYVGGLFTAINGVAASNVAHWNGSAWSALAQGTNGQVHALASSASGGVHVGGNFNTAGLLAAPWVATWRLGSWTAPPAMPLAPDIGTAWALLEAADGNVLVGGNFANLGTGVSAYALRYNPVAGTWTSLGGLNNMVSAWASVGGEIYAGGAFSHVTPWSHAIARLDGDVLVGCGYLLGMTRALAVDADGHLVAGCDLTWNNGAFREPNLYRQVDGDWRGFALANGTDGYARALAVDDRGRLVYGSTSRITDGMYDAQVGYAWPDVRIPLNMGINECTSLLATGDGKLYVGAASSYRAVQRLAGGVRTELGAPTALSHATAMARAADGTLYATARTNTGFLVKAWNGTSWDVLGGEADSTINALIVHDGVLYAGGFFTSINGVSANHVAAWYDGAWHELMSGRPGEVTCFAAAPDGSLLAGGDGLAAWTGTAWLSLPAGYRSDSIEAMAYDDLGNLYLAHDSGGRILERLVGSTWSAVPGAELVNRLFALHPVRGGGMAIGGVIARLGGEVSAGVAFLTGPVSWNLSHGAGPIDPGSDVVVTATASATVSSLLTSHVVVENGTCTAISGSGSTYQLTIHPTVGAGGVVGVHLSAGAALAADGLGTVPSEQHRIEVRDSITFTTPATAIYGQVRTLAATTASGTAVSYVVISGSATLSGSSLTLTGSSGDVVIEARQPGDATHAAAAPVQRTITLGKAPLTCTATSFTIAPGTAVPTLSLGWSGFRLGDLVGTAVTGTPLLATTATDSSPVGTYPITVDLTGVSATNYTISAVDGQVVIARGGSSGGGGGGGGGGGCGAGGGSALAGIGLLLVGLRRRLKR